MSYAPYNNQNNASKGVSYGTLALVIACIVGVAGLTALIFMGHADAVESVEKVRQSSSINPETAKDPREGVVKLLTYGQEPGVELTKTCDGTTLVYLSQQSRGGGVAAIPNSDECKATKK